MFESWADVGISGHANVLRLLYNDAARALVVEVSEHLESLGGIAVKRLFSRLVVESWYRPIPAENSFVTQTDGTSCAAAGFLVFNELQFRPADGDMGVGAADWFALRRFDLRSGVSDLAVDARDLRVPAPYRSGWVSEILAAWPNGDGAVCKVGLERHPDADGKVMVDYFVYDVSFKDGLVREIATLPLIHL